MNVNTRTTDLEKYKIKPPSRDGPITERRSNTAPRGGRVLSARSNITTNSQKPKEVLKSPLTGGPKIDISRANSLSKVRPVTKGEKIYSFLYARKILNGTKYTGASKININAMPVHKGTISLLLNIKTKEERSLFSNFKEKISSKAKFKIKWKTIQWLIHNKRETIQILSQQYPLIIKAFRSKGAVDGLNREDFGELLSYVGMGGEKALADKLFFIFDDDGNGTVDYRELIMGLETFKEGTFQEKLQVFFDLCDIDGSGTVTKKELYDVLKRNCLSEAERTKLKKTINTIFLQADTDRNGSLDKQELMDFAMRDQQLHHIIEENIRSIRRVDKIIESDLDDAYHGWTPMSGGGMINSREGVHFPLVNQFLAAIKQQEDIKYETRRNKLEYIEQMKKMKLPIGEHESESEEDI